MAKQSIRESSIKAGGCSWFVCGFALATLIGLVAGCARSASHHCADGTICPSTKECVAGRCISLSCGDGVLDPELGEECDCGDGTVAFRPAGCTEHNDDQVGQCRTDCLRHCGDGKVNAEEACDGAPPEGESCYTLGFDLGRLGCSEQCTVSGIESCRYLGWARQPRLTGENLRGIWGNNASDIYAVGWDGAIVHFDGTRWQADLVDEMGKPLLDNRLFTIWGRSSDGYVYVGGQGGLILRRRAGDPLSSWTTHAELAQGSDVNGIWGLPNSSRLIAVGDAGRIWTFDGTTWSVTHSGNLPVLDPSHNPAVDLHAVWGTSFNNVYAVGDDFSIFHFNGTVWSVLSSIGPTTNDSDDDWNAIWGSGSSDIYVVGDQARVSHFADGQWVPVVLPSVVDDLRLHGIWGSGPGHVFISGDDGMTLHYDGNHWVALRATQPEHLYGFWGSSAENVYTIGNSGLLAHHSGMAWATTGFITAGEVHDVWGRNPTDIYAVGDRGQVLRYQGRDWLPYLLRDELGSQITTTRKLRAITGSASGTMIIAGDDGTLIRYNGLAWHNESLAATTRDFYDVWTDESGQAYAVGQQGMMARFDGVNWSPMNQTVATGNLNGVWGASPSDVWVVGDYDESNARAVLLHIRDSDVESVELDIKEDLHGVWGSGPDDMYIAGKDGELWHYDGTDWQAIDSSIAQDLHGLTGNSRGERFAVGGNGAVIYFDGQAWQQVRSGTFERFNAVWAGDQDVIMVGDHGVVETLVFTAR